MGIYTVNGQPVKYNNKWLGQDGAPSSDLPSYDSTDAGKILRVNSSGTGLNWDEEEGEQYTAGSGISISNNEISVDTSVIATQSDLTSGLADKQDVLTAGQNITIQNNVISATGSFSQVQSDWTEADTADPSYIQNKPAETGLVAGSNISIVDSVGGVEISAIIPDSNLLVIPLDAAPSTQAEKQALFDQVDTAVAANKQVVIKTTSSGNKIRHFALTNTNNLSANGKFFHFNCIEMAENLQMSMDAIDHWMVVSYDSFDTDPYNFTVVDHTIASGLTSSSFDPFSA